MKSCPNKDERGNYTCPYPYNCITYKKGDLQENNGDDARPDLVDQHVCELEWYASVFHFEQCLSELPKDNAIQGGKCRKTFTKCLNRRTRKVNGETVTILQPGVTKTFQDYIKQLLKGPNDYTSKNPLFKRPCNEEIFGNLTDIFAKLDPIVENRDDVFSTEDKDGYETIDDFADPENY